MPFLLCLPPQKYAGPPFATWYSTGLNALPRWEPSLKR